MPGVEVSLGGMLTEGSLTTLVIFDKPDPLDGPFFEETIYVTPSRLPEATQRGVAASAGQAARALGLSDGPVHAELRINDAGPWLIASLERERPAAGVMMIPIPRGGVLEEVCGLEAAGAVAGIEDVTISIPRGHALLDLTIL